MRNRSAPSTNIRGSASSPAIRRRVGLLSVLSAVVLLALLNIPNGAALDEQRAGGALADPDVMLPSPSGSEGDWPEVVETGTQDAYIDHEIGEADNLATPKVAIKAGRVDGLPWSLAAYVATADSISEGLTAPAPCGQVFLGDQGAYGGGGFCLTPVSLAGGQVEMVGVAWGMTSTTAYAGVVGSGVGGVELVVDGDPAPHDAELVAAPDIPEARFFLIFVPKNAAGNVVVHGVGKEVIAEVPLCLAGAPITAESTLGCMMNGFG